MKKSKSSPLNEPASSSPLLKVLNLKKSYPIRRGVFKKEVGRVTAVDNVSFTLSRQEIVGLVGESGSGKSTLGRCALRLEEPSSGQIFFEGEDLIAYKKNEMRLLRKNIQMIFQDPLSSLNPRKRVFENIGNALLYHKLVKNKKELISEVLAIMKMVGLPPEGIEKYPHQFSGGQQQRISIGRAIAMRPKLIICDESVSALDLSVQAQILNLLFELKKKLNLSYLFISHDLSVVRNFCDTVLVMYKGKIVEEGPAASLFENPKHPYTKQLLAAVPKAHPADKREFLSSLATREPPKKGGCTYYSRCPLAQAECKHYTPAPKQGQHLKHCYTCIH